MECWDIIFRRNNEVIWSLRSELLGAELVEYFEDGQELV